MFKLYDNMPKVNRQYEIKGLALTWSLNLYLKQFEKLHSWVEIEQN